VPIARYFISVGGTLAALLFIAGWCLPTPPAMFADQLAIDRTIIRIKSTRKWPEKVVLDTGHPTITPPAVEQPAAAQSVRHPSDQAGNQSNLETMAQLEPDTQPAAVDHPTLHPILQVKRGVARTARSKRRITRQLARAEAGGGCCQFGWIDNRQANSNATPRRDAASPWSMNWLAPTGRN
jgi:hypothetical protein